MGLVLLSNASHNSFGLFPGVGRAKASSQVIFLVMIESTYISMSIMRKPVLAPNIWKEVADSRAAEDILSELEEMNVDYSKVHCCKGNCIVATLAVREFSGSL